MLTTLASSSIFSEELHLADYRTSHHLPEKTKLDMDTPSQSVILPWCNTKPIEITREGEKRPKIYE